MAKDNKLNPDTWVDTYGDQLYRYAYVRVSNHSVAQDIVQDTLVAAFKAADRFDGRASERTWLMAILKNKIVDHYRKSSRETLVDDIETRDIENSTEFKWMGISTRKPAPWEINPQKAFEQKEFWDVYSRCITKLKGNIHTAYVRREIDGHSTEEICKEMGLTSNHLWVMLHRARAQLKKCLEVNWIQKTQDA